MHFSEFVEQSNGFYTYFILWSASSEKYYPKGVQCKGNTIAINVQDTITYFMICIITHSRMKEKPYRIYKMRDRETKLNSLLRTFQTKLFTAIATATTLLQWMHVCVKCIYIQTISNDGFFLFLPPNVLFLITMWKRRKKNPWHVYHVWTSMSPQFIALSF